MKIYLLSLLCLPLAVLAQQFKLVSQSPTNCVFEFRMEEKTIPTTHIGGSDYLHFPKLFPVVSSEPGAPALPVFSTTLRIPSGSSPQVTILADEILDIEGQQVAPSKGKLKRNLNPEDVPYTFGAVYSQNDFYPSSQLSAKSPFQWRSLNGQVLSISPYQYNPVTGTLRLHTRLLVRVEFGMVLTKLTDAVLAQAQMKQVLNPDLDKYNQIEEQGEMLVIADPSFTGALSDFVNWKNQKGIRTTMVTTAVTGTSDIEIKQFIQDFYQTHPNLIYLLLAGDHEQIPAHSYGDNGSEILWSDSYYSQLAGGVDDFYPELFIGRFSGNAQEIQRMASRVCEYEQRPAAGNWMERAIGLASNQGANFGDDDEPDWMHIRNLRASLLDFGYSEVYEFYDGSHGDQDAAGNPNSTHVLPALNNGVGLFNYCGHGDLHIMHSGSFTSTNVNQATNAGQYPLVISVACNNGTFANNSCISEAWLRASNNGQTTGAIAAAGSSILMAWAAPMQTQDEMTAILTNQYTDNVKTTIGGLFYNAQCSMLDTYPDATGQEVMQTWILFGDPSTVIRTKVTDTIRLTNIPHLDEGASSLTVDCDVAGATIAVSQNNVLLAVTEASAPGSVTLSFDPLTSDLPVVITATKQNYVSEQQSAQVGEGPLGIHESVQSEVRVYPNPATDVFHIISSAEVQSVSVLDLNGRSIATHTSGINQISVSTLSDGVYLLLIETAKGSHIKKVTVRH